MFRCFYHKVMQQYTASSVYLPNRGLAKLLSWVFVTEKDLFVCARKFFGNFFHTRIAISETFFGAWMSGRAKTGAVFLALEDDVFPIVRMTDLGTYVPTAHSSIAFLRASTFRWKICHVTRLKKLSSLQCLNLEGIFPTYFSNHIVNVAFQAEIQSQLAIRIQHFANTIPQFALALQILHIANHVETLFSS